MVEEIRTELANGEELEDIKDRSHEFIDSYLPVYYNGIIEEWKAMPSEYNDRGSAELGQRSAKYYKVRTVVRAVFWLALLAGLYLISTRLWWQGGGGYCVGTLEVCGL